MTENEAIEELKYDCNQLGKAVPSDTGWGQAIHTAYGLAIEALQEIQQYRSIGTADRFQQLAEQFSPHVIDGISCPDRHCNKCDRYRKENEKYHDIGTVEECREARERQKEEKSGGRYKMGYIGDGRKAERLTRRSENGTAIYNTSSGEPVKWENNRHEVLQKLADYEDLEEQGKL